MTERYLITGSQLGMLKAFAEGEQVEETNHLVDEIVKSQFVGKTDNPIISDVKKIRRILYYN